MRKIWILFLFPIACFADFTLKDGKLVQKDMVATEGAAEHYSNLLKFYNRKSWNILEKEALIIIKNFPGTPFARDATYYLGVAYYKQEEFEMANYQFTDYLTQTSTPKFFEATIRYKFEIAEKFRKGARKHLMGLQGMPKLLGAGHEAIGIYDEVISALPHHELAVQALYGKANVQEKNEDFRASIETYQTLIRRFPKHPLAVESYIEIGLVYLSQSQKEYPDPDYLDLAELNLKKFRSAFPGEEKVKVAAQNFGKMQEHFASSLYDTAQFYERTKKWGAAKIYYKKIQKTYPRSALAKKAEERLPIVNKKLAIIESKKTKK